MIEELQKMLIRHEGEVNHAYQDSEGYWTIGVGRLIDKRKGGGITHDEAMYLLGNDIANTVEQCITFHWFGSLSDNRKLVIANMVFNMGLPTFKQFKKTIKYIEDGRYDKAAMEMLSSRWADQVGKRATELSDLMRNG